MKSGNRSKELYQHWRNFLWHQLWTEEVPRFDRTAGRERFESAPLVRAVGVVFSESGPPEQKDEVKRWLVQLLRDPEEKIRRYAMAALPKIGVGASEEAELLALLRQTTNPREEKFLGRTLDKIGGKATLEAIEATGSLPLQTMQKVKASVARRENPSVIRLDRVLAGFDSLRIHLRGRGGLEEIVADEVDAQGKFRVLEVNPGLVVIKPLAPFSLADLFALRCFGTVGFVLGHVESTSEAKFIEALAATIASPLSQRLFDTFTQGSIRYRLEFIDRGHQRSAVRRVAERAFELCPRILNDAREAPWAIDLHPAGRGHTVELRPRLSPDPRHPYRLGDVPAASHPPLAACLARIAGQMENEIVWDPFCGSGQELIERALLGGVRCVHGTDLSPEAIDIAQRNFLAARFTAVEAHFTCCDFRDFAASTGLPPRSLSLIISNPPLGRRVRIPGLHALFDDLFASAAAMLRPGGRLVFTNPFRMESPQPSLQLEFRQVVDLGGFDCQVEVYRKAAR
jgi:23S rRNA G2445 N2-methylase RlmL